MKRTRAVGIAVAVVAGLALAAPPAGADTGRRGVGGDAVFFATSLNGANEVPVAQGPAVGDQDGRATAFLRVQGEKVSFAIAFQSIAAPTGGDLDQGVKGTNGTLRLALFTQRLGDGRSSVTGTVQVKDPGLLDDLRSNPGSFYLNLRTGEFPGGAVRGQLHKLSSIIDINRALQNNFQRSVIQGVQIYACTKQADGSFAFTQDNVRASLEGGISHFFVNPGPAGPPEWLASDGSAVTGKLIAKTPNGDANIAELDLAATQAGRSYGLLARINEILRLNTVGGVAPSGTCDSATQPRVEVPYHADYVFIDAADATHG